MKAERSVRRRLLGWLLLPLAMVLVASGIVTYQASLKVAADAYDRSLLDPALAIAGRLRVNGATIELDLPPSVLEALQVDSGDRLFFSVAANGRLLAGEHVRVAAIMVPAAGGPVMVQAAETVAKRERIAREVLIRFNSLGACRRHGRNRNRSAAVISGYIRARGRTPSRRQR